ARSSKDCWNSRAMARIRATYCPATRITRGKSFGPTNTIASTAMRRSSDQPISNMTVPGLRQARPFGRAPKASAVRRLVLGGRAAVLRGHAFDDLRVALGRGLVLFLQSLLEGVDALRHIAHQARNLARSEEQHNEG